jgi:hypothetical protein
MDTAAQLLQGDKIGQVHSGVEQVPLLLDFRAEAKRLKLKIEQTGRQEIVLDILTKPAHRASSIFFHRLTFLHIGLGQLRAGPSYRKRDTHLVREKWQYAFSAKVEAAVIDASYLGGTVREAVATALARTQQEHNSSGDYSKLLVDAVVMDMTEYIAPLLDAMEAIIAQDGDFLSLVLAVENLLFVENAKWLLSLENTEFVGRLLAAVYQKAVALLPALETAVEEEDRRLAKTLKTLGQVSQREGIDGNVFLEALQDLCRRESPDPPVGLQGSAAGLLYAQGVFTAEEVLRLAESYLLGSGEQMKKSGRFLGGVFLSAWDILFAASGFLEGISHVLAALPPEEFLSLLPDLKLAFSTFTPRQLDRVSDLVAALLHVSPEEAAREALPEEVLRLGSSLDGYATPLL